MVSIVKELNILSTVGKENERERGEMKREREGQRGDEERKKRRERGEMKREREEVRKGERKSLTYYQVQVVSLHT